MAVTPEIVEYINSHAEMVISEAKEIIGTITNKEIELENEEAKEFDFAGISEAFPEETVAIDFTINSAPENKWFLLIDKNTAARIGSLMMMMEEEEVEFNEEHIDSMKETANQILGALSTKLNEAESTNISFENINGEVLVPAEDMFDAENLASTKITLKIGEDEPSTIYSLLPGPAVESITKGPEEGEEETAVEGEEDEEGEEAKEGEEDEGIGDLDLSGMLEDDVEEMGDVIEAPEPVIEESPKPLGEPTEKIGFLMDLTLPVSIELGRTKMLIKEVLDLGHGSVIEFDKLAGDPVDLLVENKKIAEGEVVVVDEHFGIRITSLVHKKEMLDHISSRH
ncbi:flagellar motor switch protein FliN [candidate division KSB1 bacterium]